MMTLSLTVILGMLGLAVDVGWAYYRQQAAQAAADAAAIAAVRAAVTSAAGGALNCTTPGVYCNTVNCPATAPGSPTTNFDNACMLASANGFTTSGIDTVNVQSGVTSPVPTVSGPAPAYWVVVRVNEVLPALFGAAFARGGLSPGAIATAGAMGSAAAGSCLYVLDPSAQDAFQAANGAAVTVNCGVYVDSNNSTAAMLVTGGATVTAPTISVAGKFVENNGGSTSVAPTTGAASVADPFASLPSPTPAAPLSGNFTAWQATPYTPAPGTYSGFSVGNGMSLVMSAGTYIIDGGTFSIQGGSTVTTTGGVMIYLTGGATVNIANGSSVTLSAQSSGPYQGILFYQDRSMPAPGASTFAGGATMNLTGSLYFPHATLDVNNGAAASGTTMAIVADMVDFQGGAHLLADAGGTKTGLSAGYTVSMIQ